MPKVLSGQLEAMTMRTTHNLCHTTHILAHTLRHGPAVAEVDPLTVPEHIGLVIETYHAPGKQAT